MKQVAEMLGVELDEEFNIKYSSFKFKITERGLEYFDGYDNHWYTDPSTLIGLLCGDFEITELSKSILDDKEKEYLSHIIEPFKEKIICIRKHKCVEENKEYITISYEGDDRKQAIYIPIFEKGTMYRRMKCDYKYTLDELGL